MIYLDNAATTFPKPLEVTNAVINALKKYSANPGRSGHNLSIKAAEEIFNCRKVVADFFNVPYLEDIIFTLNCTHAINIVLKGILKKGDHVIVSCLEHNAIMRPLRALSEIGVTYTVVKVYPGDNHKTLNEFKKAINSKTVLIACTHASNVWGIKLPIERISDLAHQHNIDILIDAAQTAGVIPIDFKGSNIDYLCSAGHKGLYGPMGTGILVIKNGKKINTIIEGGTGTSSVDLKQPNNLPDKFESGTPNLSGIVGLKAGIEYINKKKIENIHDIEYKIILNIYNKLLEIDKVKLYMPKPDPKYFVPLLSFNIDGIQSEQTAKLLNKFDIYTRAGLHCSPLAHKYKNTLETGTVRIAPSAFSKDSDGEALIKVIKNLIGVIR